MRNFILLLKFLKFLELFGLLTNAQNAQPILEDKVQLVALIFDVTVAAQSSKRLQSKICSKGDEKQLFWKNL